MADKAPKAMSKSEILAKIAESTGLARKDVSKVFEELSGLIAAQVGKKGPGVFAIPGLMKITVFTKPATKAGKRPNPFKPGEMMDVKAKPAQRKVRVRPLKALKDMA